MTERSMSRCLKSSRLGMVKLWQIMRNPSIKICYNIRDLHRL
jgi:hypothetical protein